MKYDYRPFYEQKNTLFIRFLTVILQQFQNNGDTVPIKNGTRKD